MDPWSPPLMFSLDHMPNEAAQMEMDWALALPLTRQ